MPSQDTLAISLYGRSVGTLTRLINETIVFAFDPEYEVDPQRPILSLSFKGPMGILVSGRTRTDTHLIPFFSNLLPEGHLRDYLAVEKITAHPFHKFVGIEFGGGGTGGQDYHSSQVDESARRTFSKALDNYRALGKENSPEAASCYQLMGDVLSTELKPRDAITYYAKANAIFEKSKASRSTGRCLGQARSDRR